MWNLSRACICSLALATATPAALFASEPAGRVIEAQVPAPSLEGNLLGTATTQGAAIYLPPGYARGETRYPSAYLLHGIFDDYETFTEFLGVPAILDRLIADGTIPEMIVVMPDAGNQYGGGFYRNSAVSGNWADYIADDLIPHIDAHYRTRATPEARAVLGHSMGGYGALHLAMTRPGLFSTVWALSPCCLAATDDFGFGNDAWKRAAAVRSDDDILALLDNRDFFAVAALGVVTAFSPDADSPPALGDFPFDVVRGETVLDAPAYDRYLDALPIRQIDDSRDALRNLRGLAIGVGLGDQFIHIPPATLAFSQRLGEERIPHRLDVYDGDHRQMVGERLEKIILPWIGEKLAPRPQDLP